MQNKGKTNQPALKFSHYLIMGTVIALIISALFKILTPKEKTLSLSNEAFTSNYNESISTFKKISFSGQEIFIPKTFTIYKVAPGNSSAERLAEQIINQNKLAVHQSISLYWVGVEFELKQSQLEQNYTLARIIDGQEKDIKIVKQEAIDACLNFYTKYNTGLKLTAQEDAILYFDKETGFQQNITEEKLAYSAQIPLTYELEGYPVFYQNENDYPFFCIVNNDYNLRKVIFKDFFYNFEAVDQLASISINQAINNIKNGTASIVSAESQIAYIIDLDLINEADLYSVAIEYRYDSELKIAYPFYKFQAKLTNSAGINIQAEIITPAVANAVEK